MAATTLASPPLVPTLEQLKGEESVVPNGIIPHEAGGESILLLPSAIVVLVIEEGQVLAVAAAVKNSREWVFSSVLRRVGIHGRFDHREAHITTESVQWMERTIVR